MDLDSAFAKYDKLIAHCARRYASAVPWMDVSDLYQDGVLLLVRIWRSNADPKQKAALFRRDLVNHLHNTIRNERSRRPHSWVTVDLDVLVGAADCSVLSAVYAREFKRELYRLFSGVDRELLQFLIGQKSLKMDHVQSSDRAAGEWLDKLSQRFGLTKSYLSQKISIIRRTIRQALAA